MKILIVEDDNYKADSLKKFIFNNIDANAEVSLATNLKDAIFSIEEKCYDYIFVDMSIPSHPTMVGQGTAFSLVKGGLEVLMEISELNRGDRCIVITQYPEIEISGNFYLVKHSKTKLKEILGCEVLDCIQYFIDDDSWQIELKKCFIK
ncbi:response regulator [Acinetobacter baumannii]|nr:response regulator [Acinetobacter baumannii]HEM7135409.1 response regulator [Acinetobacter baumannii]HEM7138345.1 response regulator [Acinetobacter baumannii]